MAAKENKIKLSPNRLADGFFQMEGIDEPTGRTKLVWWHGDFYMWKEGVYRRIADHDVKAYIARYVRGTRQTTGSNIVSSVVLNLQALAILDGETQPNSWRRRAGGPRVIVVQNGTVAFEDLDENRRPKLLPHTPDYFTMVKMPYDYDPRAECPRWLKFLEEVMEEDAERTRLLQQWAGYLLTPTLKRQRFLLCVGEGANGKGVFFSVLIEMLGPENCSSLPVGRFGERFSLASTYGKLVNATSEGISHITSQAEAVLKEWVSGDKMTFERKHGAIFHARPTAKLMIATNELPSFSDKTDGIWRRILLVPFERTFTEKEQNPNLADELKEELPGIFNWAYDGMVDLEKNGFVVPAKCKEALQQYCQDVNPAKVFLQENWEPNTEAEDVPCGLVYSLYKDWCKVKGYKPMNDANFGKEVKRVFPEVGRPRPRIKGKRTRVYANLSMREDAEIGSNDFWYEYAPFSLGGQSGHSGHRR